MIDVRAKIWCQYLEDLKIGKGSYIGAYTFLHVKNDQGMRNSFLDIGGYTYIGEMNNIRASGGIIKIGNKCLISQLVNIIASNHCINKELHISEQRWSMDKVGVVIGDDVWIGCGVTILPGVTIGTGAVIGAGSIVTKSIPEYAIAVGNPATVCRYRQNG